MILEGALAAPLPPWPLAASVLIVGLAGVVRGFAGFGFSALSVAGLALFVAPSRVVPTIFLLEILASLTLLRGARPHVDWRWLAWLIAGNAVAIPAGVALLACLPEAPLRALIGLALLTAVLAQRSGWHPGWAPTAGVRLGVGLVSGLFNGLAAIGGIAVAVLLSGSTIAPQALRATLIVMFLFTDLYSLAWAGLYQATSETAQPLLGLDTLRWALWLTPAMLLGIAIGSRAFAGVSPQRFRALILNLLTLIAALTVLRAAAQWLAG